MQYCVILNNKGNLLKNIWDFFLLCLNITCTLTKDCVAIIFKFSLYNFKILSDNQKFQIMQYKLRKMRSCIFQNYTVYLLLSNRKIKLKYKIELYSILYPGLYSINVWKKPFLASILTFQPLVISLQTSNILQY